MKNIFMPALIWALALCQTFAQKTLPPSAASHTANWTGTEKKLLEAAGFGASSVSKKQAVQTRNELQLDSTITFTAYDPAGTQDSTPYFRTVYTYNPAVAEETAVEYIYEPGEWVPLNRTTSTSDAQGRLVEIFAEFYDPAFQVWTPDSRVIIFPHGTSPDLTDSLFVAAWEPGANEWVPLMSIWNSFDNSGRIAESLTQIDIFGQPLILKDVYAYDASGDNILIESFLSEGGFDFPAGKREMTYENHYITSATSFADDGFGGSEPQDRTLYYYTGFWKEEIVEYYIWNADNSVWMEVQAVSSEYDAQERLSARITAMFEPGAGNSTGLTTYDYLEDEYIALESNFDFDFNTQEFLLLDRTYYYYSGGPVSSAPLEPVKVKMLSVSPNPAGSFTQIPLTEAASVQVFSMQGQVVREFNLQPGQMRMDVDGLPAGIYLVKAHTETGIYAGRLVKQ